ncbi:MAG: chemotaxis protein CheW [Gammaproteobacteria bacterium]
MSADSSVAWLLCVGAERRVATAMHEVIQILPIPKIVPVPSAPAHCRLTTLWEDKVVPVMELNVLLAGQPPQPPSNYHYVGVVAWQDQPRNPLQYGGLLLTEPPWQHWVHDNQMCEPADERALWRQVCWCCVSHENGIVPILNIQRLFTTSGHLLTAN